MSNAVNVSTGANPKFYKHQTDVFKKPLISNKIEKKVDRQQNFKRPLSIIKKTGKRREKSERTLTTGEIFEKPDLQKENERLLNELSDLFAVPPLLSPIRAQFVINPCSMKQFSYQPRLIDANIKTMIDNFAKNIDALSRGGSYQELTPETLSPTSDDSEFIQEEFRAKKRRSTEKIVASKKRVKVTRG